MHNTSLKTVKVLSMFGSAVILAVCGFTPALTAPRFVDDDVDDVATHIVDDDKVECPKAKFNRIQSAVDAAAPGDNIHVCPGTYDEQVEIAKPLSIRGIGRDGKKAAVVQPSNMTANSDFLGDPLAAAILVRDTAGVTIRNITVDGINNGAVCEPTPPFLDGIFFRNASGAIELVAIKNMLSPHGCAFGDGIDVLTSEGGTSRLTVRDSSIHDYDTAGILSWGPGVSLRATRNVVTGLGPSTNGQAGIQLAEGAAGLVDDNIVTNHVFAPCPTPSDCEFISHGIGAFATGEVSIVGNTVGKSNVGIFAGSFRENAADGVRVLANRVFDSDVFHGHGIVVGEGKNNVVKDNIITNSDRAGVFVAGTNNTIRDNTIHEAAFGLLVSAGNRLLDNRFFNTGVIREVFVPASSLASSQRAPMSDATARSLLRRRVPR